MCEYNLSGSRMDHLANSSSRAKRRCRETAELWRSPTAGKASLHKISDTNIAQVTYMEANATTFYFERKAVQLERVKMHSSCIPRLWVS